MQTTKKLAQKHKELNKEVKDLSEQSYLTEEEQKNLQVLKKLKLAYKDALVKDSRLSYDD
jgi:uncharacterized protein YdcH (DUF465 family)|tara:strand:- start:25 stop:204 length:180 start_codon:yes stop_codon:yes gene_type:complete